MSYGFHRIGMGADREERLIAATIADIRAHGSPKARVAAGAIAAVAKVSAPAPVPAAKLVAVDPISPTDLGPPRMDRVTARQAGYTGNTCATCGSLQMVRNGTCEKCESCGSTTGCS